MSISIDRTKCRKCGRCQTVCPGTLIGRADDGTAVMRYPKDCWGCTSCLKECAFGAISFYLGADLGGRGGRMQVTARGRFLDWTVTRADGSVKTIVIDKKESNKY